MSKLDHNNTRSSLPRFVLGVVVPVVVCILWEIAGRYQWLPNSVFAPLSQTLAAGGKLLFSGELLRHAGISILRLAFGVSIGLLCGLIFGTLIGAYKVFERLFGPMVSFLLPVPPIAWIPFCIVIFGIGGSRIALISIGTFLFVAAATANGIRSLNREIIEVAELYECHGPKLIFTVLLRGAAPEIVGGIRSGVGISWILLVASELIASSSGIGWLMWNSRTFSRPDDMLAACLTIALLGIGVDTALAHLQARVSAWRKTFMGQ